MASALHAAAGPVSQDAAAPPSDLASAASRMVSEDTGDAAKLARMVDEIARSGPASAPPSRGGSRQAGGREGGAGASRDAGHGDDGGPAEEGPQRPTWLGGGDDGTPGSARGRPVDGAAPGTLLDQVAPEDRTKVRELVFMIKSVLYHPVTWVVFVLVVGASAVLSAGGRRRK
ncbi:MAG: hypothetical protein JSR59_22485 [Proteobacteria bacterium]|nr:hypothetical protein [Pseudomonadota bacterium]